MAARTPRVAIDHLTVVPVGFDPDDEGESGSDSDREGDGNPGSNRPT
ncbi:hypothetical protein [Halorubrum sp. JWXQ-INN 858]|nr:hypothetical protein [Halorubrum sp. JWXQ-INN 858]